MAKLTPEQLEKRKKINKIIFSVFALCMMAMVAVYFVCKNIEVEQAKQSLITEQSARAELKTLLIELDTIRQTEEFKTSLYGKGIGAKWDAKRKILVEKIKEADLSFNLKLASTELWALGKAYVRNTDENPYTLRKEIEGYLQ